MSSMSKKKKKMSGIQKRNNINFYLVHITVAAVLSCLTVYPMLSL